MADLAMFQKHEQIAQTEKQRQDRIKIMSQMAERIDPADLPTLMGHLGEMLDAKTQKQMDEIYGKFTHNFINQDYQQEQQGKLRNAYAGAFNQEMDAATQDQQAQRAQGGMLIGGGQPMPSINAGPTVEGSPAMLPDIAAKVYAKPEQSIQVAPEVRVQSEDAPPPRLATKDPAAYAGGKMRITDPEVKAQRALDMSMQKIRLQNELLSDRQRQLAADKHEFTMKEITERNQAKQDQFIQKIKSGSLKNLTPGVTDEDGNQVYTYEVPQFDADGKLLGMKTESQVLDAKNVSWLNTHNKLEEAKSRHAILNDKAKKQIEEIDYKIKNNVYLNKTIGIQDKTALEAAKSTLSMLQAKHKSLLDEMKAEVAKGPLKTGKTDKIQTAIDEVEKTMKAAIDGMKDIGNKSVVPTGGAKSGTNPTTTPSAVKPGRVGQYTNVP